MTSVLLLQSWLEMAEFQCSIPDKSDFLIIFIQDDVCPKYFVPSFIFCMLLTDGSQFLSLECL